MSFRVSRSYRLLRQLQPRSTLSTQTPIRYRCINPTKSVEQARSISFTPTSQFRATQKLSVVPPEMKAVLIKDGKGPVENLYLGEEATPEPEKGQVQVQVCPIPTFVEVTKLIPHLDQSMLYPSNLCPRHPSETTGTVLIIASELRSEPYGYHATGG